MEFDQCCIVKQTLISFEFNRRIKYKVQIVMSTGYFKVIHTSRLFFLFGLLLVRTFRI